MGDRPDGLFARLAPALAWRPGNGALFHKYVALFAAVVLVALLANGALEIGFAYRDHRSALVSIQRAQADAAAEKIGQFIREIETQVGWTTQLPWSEASLDQRRFDGQRLLRQAPAITELTQVDPSGKEQLHVSRISMDRVASRADFSGDVAFAEASSKKIYYGPVYFRRKTEPYMTLALAGSRRDGGVSIVEVNLKVIWDVVAQMKVGERGRTYVVDGTGRLIAHSDISLVLRNTDMAASSQVKAARAAASDAPIEPGRSATDLAGHAVLTTHASIMPLDWLVFVELPTAEANAPLYAAIWRSGLLLLAGLALALVSGLFLARRMVVPIRAMQASAARIGGGDLSQRISIKTGDELEALADQFNSMAGQLEDSYRGLERRVEERTHQLELSNLAKSRFLAAASHDLRQPVQALSLFVEQLRDHMKSAEGDRLFERISAAVAAMNELFNALLDISKLDAGVLSTDVTEFSLSRLQSRIEATFSEAAREKGLSFHFVPSSLWVRSDLILLERIVLNLVSNAVRYTEQGGVVIGCRRRGDTVRIEVYDTGPGIPAEQQRNIFAEFYRLAGSRRDGGLGLGLAIVERLCGLLDHPIELASIGGRGSRFSITLPVATARTASSSHGALPMQTGSVEGKRVVVIDDDALVLEGLCGILRKWGWHVIAAATADAALAEIDRDAPPDIIISDCQLANGESGVSAIAAIRNACGISMPALLVSGDSAPERLREAQERGYHLLHKPVQPMRLRSTLNRLLDTSAVA